MVKKPLNSIDKHVGSRVRMRRMMLGMSQEKLGKTLDEIIGSHFVGKPRDYWVRAAADLI